MFTKLKSSFQRWCIRWRVTDQQATKAAEIGARQVEDWIDEVRANGAVVLYVDRDGKIQELSLR